jgi:hypothetical protein
MNFPGPRWGKHYPIYSKKEFPGKGGVLVHFQVTNFFWTVCLSKIVIVEFAFQQFFFAPKLLSWLLPPAPWLVQHLFEFALAPPPEPSIQMLSVVAPQRFVFEVPRMPIL